jgi:hypothetical protein
MIKYTLPFALSLVFLAGCSSSPDAEPTNDTPPTAFSTVLWREKVQDDYPNRIHVYEEILYSDSVRTLTKNEILEMLGTPDRTGEGHIYYLIKQERLGLWPLHTKFLVFKFTPQDSVEWIKTHG